ncbi:MAG: hypothetical protein B6U69_03805 [Thermofilum sp. ex4484_15]|nr:MAG: hypothetical protein B6U69_03805 [Thermofilum sp. ex4484_15]
MKVGIVGTGLMGSGLAKRLAKVGYEVHVWNRTKEKALKLTDFGVKVEDTLRDLVNEVSTIHIFVSDDEAVREVVYGKGGILEAISPGKLVINHSTVTPLLNVELYNTFKSKGVDFLECPVLGSWPEAEEGKLDSLVGGEPKTFEKYEELLRSFSRIVFYVGEVGKASALKLATNLMLFNIALSLSEALSLAEVWGVEPNKVLDYFSRTWLKAVAERYGRRLLREEQIVRFRLILAAKDLSYATSSARIKGQPMPLTSTSAQVYLEAAANGFSEEDYSRIYYFIRRRAGR